MSCTVAKEFLFEAAHALPHLPEGHKCRRLHGHSYRFRVVVAGSVNSDTGMLLDYAEISKVVDPIVERLDHQNLNDLFRFHTTAENLAAWLHHEIGKAIPVHQIVFFETASTRVTYG